MKHKGIKCADNTKPIRSAVREYVYSISVFSSGWSIGCLWSKEDEMRGATNHYL